MLSTCVETDDGWEAFKQKFKISYPTQEEDDMRHKLYLDSLVEIEKLSKEYPETQFAPTKVSIDTITNPLSS